MPMPTPDMPPPAHVVHAVTGRTRLLVPARRGDATFFARIRDSMRAMAGVDAVAATPRAGSVVIRHRGPFAPLAAAAEAAGLFTLTAPLAPAPRPAAARRVPGLALAAGGLAGLSAVQLARGQVAGNAIELLWNGYQARTRLGLPAVARVLVGVGLVQLARGQVLGSATSLLFYALTARLLARGQPRGG